MAWTFVRPSDPAVLSGRPLLDLGTGDGQTVAALTAREGLVVGLDRSADALRAARIAGAEPLVRAEASAVPFRGQAFGAVLAGDLFHHLDDVSLAVVLAEALGVLRQTGLLVAWWYTEHAHATPDAPAYPRSFEDVAAFVRRAGFGSIGMLALEIVLPGGPQTVGLTAVPAG